MKQKAKKGNVINDIRQKDSTTMQERILLGLIDSEADRIGYGKIIIELNVRAGNLDFVNLKEVSRTVNLGMRDTKL